MPRLGHKKSRNGCRQCKARHVKCDESRPCSNCARHGVVCSLVDPDAPLPVPAATGGSSGPRRIPKTLVERPNQEPEQLQTSSPSVGSIIQPLAETTIRMTPSEGDSPSSSSDGFPFITRFVKNNEPVHANLWLKDLELMHHWLVHAIDSLTQRPDLQRTWRFIATKLAADCAFLMHEILAFSALHLASLETDKRREWSALGDHHQDQALQGMRKSLLNLTDQTVSPVFATSLLITMSVWASRGQDALEPGPHAQDAIDDLLDVFALQSGVGKIMETQQLRVVRGPFHTFFNDPITETPPQPLFPQIIENLATLTAAVEKSTSIDDDTRHDLLGVIASMRIMLLRSCRPCEDNREMKFLFSWPIRLSQSYMIQLRQREESALAILLFYSVALYAGEPIYWFMRGWADRTMRAISDHIKDPEWRTAVAWPLHFMERQRSKPPAEPVVATAFPVE